MDHRHSGSSSDSFGRFCVVCSLGDQRQRIRERGSDGLYSKMSGGMNMTHTVYVKLDEITELTHKDILLKDVAQVYCRD